jgi:hypothetical protein
MSNKLKAITTKAKALYKTGKYKKWTDAIKAASKTVGAVKTKRVVKKAAPKKKAAIKKKATAKSYHKDTKSHNVKINVTSGIGSLMTQLKDQYGKLSAKKLLEKTKRGKKQLQKDMSTVAKKLRKLQTF